VKTSGDWRYIIIFYLSTRRKLAVSFTLLPLYLGANSPPFSLDMRLGGRQSRLGRHGVKIISRPCRESNPDRPTRNLSLWRPDFPVTDNSWVHREIPRLTWKSKAHKYSYDPSQMNTDLTLVNAFSFNIILPSKTVIIAVFTSVFPSEACIYVISQSVQRLATHWTA
jgi:hypothetical protein